MMNNTLSRSAFKAARRQAFRLAVFGRVARVPFNSTSKIEEPEVVQESQIPVVSYAQGQKRQEELQVEHANRQAAAAAAASGSNANLGAIPLKISSTEHLTPTLQRFTLFGKVAVVTGAGRGLGFSMAQGLAEVGVRGIAIMDVQHEIGEQAARELNEQTGIDVRYYKLDVRDGDATKQAMQDVFDHYGQIDILLNAAGIVDPNVKAETYDVENFRRLLDVNITGSFLTAQAVGQQMIKSGTGGSIINIASISGSIVNYPQEQSCYNASKAAVIQLTKSLAAEWAQYGIRVNSISPGHMDTAINTSEALEAQKKIWIANTPQKRLGAPRDLNNLAVYLASDASSFMTGNNCVIDGGYTVW